VRYDSLPELVPLVDLAAEVGASQVTISHFRPVRESHRYQSLFYHRGESNAAFRAAAKRAAELRIDFVAPRPFEIPEFVEDIDVDLPSGRAPVKVAGEEVVEPPCFHPWTSVSVSEQGDVMPCCATNTVMGNLKKQDFKSIWNGRRYRKLRNTVNSSRPPSYCQGCVLRGVNLDSAHGQLYTDESYLLRSIGVQPEAGGVGELLDVMRRKAMNAARAGLRSNGVARRLALGLKRLYWRLG
jgi:radical SAM protein with 4Fe4S-binding SPASM domain